jgi:hypothetical protein
METALKLLSVAVVPLLVFLWIGGPILLTDWLRGRREEAVRHQVALTDAIDAELGSIVSPVVKKPVWGPWQILIAIPLARPAAVGKILALTHEVFSVTEGMTPDRYQIVLTPKQESMREEKMTRTSQPAVRWPRDTRVAA